MVTGRADVKPEKMSILILNGVFVATAIVETETDYEEFIDALAVARECLRRSNLGA